MGDMGGELLIEFEAAGAGGAGLACLSFGTLSSPSLRACSFERHVYIEADSYSNKLSNSVIRLLIRHLSFRCLFIACTDAPHQVHE